MDWMIQARARDFLPISMQAVEPTYTPVH